MTASEPFVIYADTREQCVPPFPAGCVVERRKMGEADYSTPSLLDIARVERKSPSDFASTITAGRDRFERELARLRALRWKCVVVDGDYDDVFLSSAVHPHSVIGTMASMLARWDCPVLFAGNPSGCGRLIAGLLRRWEERCQIEASVPQTSAEHGAELSATVDRVLP